MNDLVTIVIATKNEEKNIKSFLDSVKAQTYDNIEVILIDNFSTDKTIDIASDYKINIIQKGPERSSQRNYGANLAKGDYILFPDADMVLSPKVVAECIFTIQQDSNAVAIIIPEISIGQGFWAKCRKLEKEFYVGNDSIEAARFFKKHTFDKLKGYDATLISGEDWDLSNRARKLGGIMRITAPIYHNDGTMNLIKTAKKKFYYGKKISTFTLKNDNSEVGTNQMGVVARYKMFLKDPKKLFSNPLVGTGLLVLKTVEFSAIALGMLISAPKEAQKLIMQNLKDIFRQIVRLK